MRTPFRLAKHYRSGRYELSCCRSANIQLRQRDSVVRGVTRSSLCILKTWPAIESYEESRNRAFPA
jgi:hypothetical protein